MSDVERHYRRDLAGLGEDGRPCEVCGGHMHSHDWADPDLYGYVIDCSEVVR